MKNFYLLCFISACFFNSANAQLLMNEQFDAYANGTLSGKGPWVTINGSTLVINVANASPITGCSGGGGSYVVPGAAATSTSQRLSYPTTGFGASSSQVFYLSFLLNLSSAGSDVNAHIIGLGTDFSPETYEFIRIHARSAGAGFNIGISEGSDLGLGSNSANGISWGAGVYNLNQTYHIVLRYDYSNGGANDDVSRAWVNPVFSAGSEPAVGSAEVIIAAGALGNDNIYPNDNIRNVYLNYQNMNSPVYRIDAIRYARGATSAAAWTNIGIPGPCSTVLPLKWLKSNAMIDHQSRPVLTWEVEESNVDHYVVERSTNGENYVFVTLISSKGDGIHEYRFTENNPVNGAVLYRIRQVDSDGKSSYSAVMLVKNRGAEIISVYPNPVKSHVTVNITGSGLLNTTAMLYDMNGRLVNKIILNQNINFINMQLYKPGVYSLLLQNGKRVKLVKE